jgi:hypothetical protein
MFDSKYLGAWDLMGQDVTVTIAKVVGAVVEGEGGLKKRAPIIFFKGWDKPMVANKTFVATMKLVYGVTKVPGYIGKRCTLYATTCKGARGGIVDCVRMRPVKPASPGVPQSAIGTVPVDQEMRRNQIEQAGEMPVRSKQQQQGPAREPGED